VVWLYFRRLYELREDRDLTQKEVAEYLSMQPNVYRRYEKGLREIPVWAVVKLARYYKTSTDYILGLTDDARPPKR
jgi:transcriptional regulator with XRE-family HTH domain